MKPMDYQIQLAQANQQAALLSWAVLYAVALFVAIAAALWLFKLAKQKKAQREQYHRNRVIANRRAQLHTNREKNAREKAMHGQETTIYLNGEAIRFKPFNEFGKGRCSPSNKSA